PIDGPGIGAVDPPPPLRQLPDQLAWFGAEFDKSRRSHTWEGLPWAAMNQAREIGAFAISDVVVVLAALGMLAAGTAQLTFAAFVVFLFALHLGFHWHPGFYMFETWP